MHKRQNRLDTLLKKSKFKTSFKLCIYLQQFVSISLLKQGTYFVMASLESKNVGFRNKIDQAQEIVGSKSFSTLTFPVKYNNQIEVLHHMGTLCFNLEQSLHQRNHPHTMILSFQLFNLKNTQVLEDPTSSKIYESVSAYNFEIKIHDNLSFVEFFDLRFPLPYCADLTGFVSCLITRFQISHVEEICRLVTALAEDHRLHKVKRNAQYLHFLRKKAKQECFSSFSVQKILQQTFAGFKSDLTMTKKPQTKKQAQKDSTMLTTQNPQPYSSKMQKNPQTLQQSNSNPQNEQNEQKQKESYSYSQKSQSLSNNSKLSQYGQKCSQDHYIQYFVQIDNQDINGLLNFILQIGMRNQQVFREIAVRVQSVKEDVSMLSAAVNLTHIIKDFKSRRSIIYSQKTAEFGQSRPSAAQQMQTYKKILSSLKSKQKQNFFTPMSQIFHLIPSLSLDITQISTLFDKCPYIFYSSQQMQNGFKYQDIDDDSGMEIQSVKDTNQSKKNQFKNVFILAHGYQGSSSNMEKFKIGLKKLFLKSKVFLLKSYSNHMDRRLEEMGQKSAKQIETYIQHVEQSSSKKIRLILIGHSMGGIILRACIPYLNKKTTSLFHTFISFATPHLGYLHCKNLLTQTGIKIIQSMHPSTSLKQLSNKDNINIKETFIYKLANLGSLKSFQNIIVVSSIEDKYVPWNSARIQLYKEPEGVGGKNTIGGWAMCSQKHYLRFVEKEMISQIFGVGQGSKSRVKKIHRFDIDFNINHVNLDTVIGRTAHVAFLANDHIFPILFENILSKDLFSQLKSN